MVKTRRTRHPRSKSRSRSRSRSRGRRGGEGTTVVTDEPLTMGTAAALTEGATDEMRGGKRRRGRRRMRGGAGGADWAMANFGSTTEQIYQNTFGNGGNGNAGNLIPTLTGAPAVNPNVNVPQGSLAQYAGPGPQSGGSRHRRSRGKRGGYWSQVVQQALVPFGLLGLQNFYGKRTRKHHK